MYFFRCIQNCLRKKNPSQQSVFQGRCLTCSSLDRTQIVWRWSLYNNDTATNQFIEVSNLEEIAPTTGILELYIIVVVDITFYYLMFTNITRLYQWYILNIQQIMGANLPYPWYFTFYPHLPYAWFVGQNAPSHRLCVIPHYP